MTTKRPTRRKLLPDPGLPDEEVALNVEAVLKRLFRKPMTLDEADRADDVADRLGRRRSAHRSHVGRCYANASNALRREER